MAKYVRLVSDIHLEAFYGKSPDILVKEFIPHDPRDIDSILVLAGDISSRPDQLLEFLMEVELKFDKVIYVMGNHEVYRQNYPEWCLHTGMSLAQNLVNTHFALNVVKNFTINGTRFIFGPLWGDGGITPQDRQEVGYGLNDFRIIRNGLRSFTVEDMVEIYKTQRDAIEEYLKEPGHDGKTFVITHHLPSRKLVSERFRAPYSDGINGGFVGACDYMFEKDYAPDFWLFGHTHDTLDITIRNTRCMSNPVGYRSEWGSPFTKYQPLFINLE